jgi:hypothetical protein
MSLNASKVLVMKLNILRKEGLVAARTAQTILIKISLMKPILIVFPKSVLIETLLKEIVSMDTVRSFLILKDLNIINHKKTLNMTES